MKIQEADAKTLLVAAGLPVPPWAVARTPAEARAAAERFLGRRRRTRRDQGPGPRGRPGQGRRRQAGRRRRPEAEDVAGRILGMDIKGITVRKVLVGPAAVIVKEFYLGAILDRATRRIVLMASAEGGVEIEEVAKVTPEAIHRVEAHPLLGLLDYQARELAFAVGLAGPHLRDFVKIAKGLVATMKVERRRPRRGQPAGDHPRERPGGPRRAPRLPRRQDHPRRLRASPATPTSRSCATSTRRIRPTPRPATTTSASSTSTARSAAWSTAPAWR